MISLNIQTLKDVIRPHSFFRFFIACSVCLITSGCLDNLQAAQLTVHGAGLIKAVAEEADKLGPFIDKFKWRITQSEPNPEEGNKTQPSDEKIVCAGYVRGYARSIAEAVRLGLNCGDRNIAHDSDRSSSSQSAQFYQRLSRQDYVDCKYKWENIQNTPQIKLVEDFLASPCGQKYSYGNNRYASFYGVAASLLDDLKKQRTDHLIVSNSSVGSTLQSSQIAFTNWSDQLETISSSNIRSNPSVSSQRLSTLAEGSRVEVTGKAVVEGKLWYRIKTSRHAEAYVFGSLLKKTKTTVAALESYDRIWCLSI